MVVLRIEDSAGNIHASVDIYSWDQHACSAAAKNGHLEVLKYLRENRCPWNSFVCSHAAERGHLEVVKWAHENGCPWNRRFC